MISFDELTTPCLLVDEAKLQANIDRLARHAGHLGVQLRPHLKTTKSLDVARRVLTCGTGPATVSTLAEAEVFARAGVRDILYAVGIAPQKLPRVAQLRAGGCDATVILDSVAQAREVAATRIPALIEIDCDGHRGGLRADDPVLLEVARILHQGNALRGVLTHAGESYNVSGRQAHAQLAALERDAVVAAAAVLRAEDLPCEVVSVGSTPTAHAAEDLTGVTELRAGVYVFQDLVMAGIGVCTPEQIALSVLTTVIGHQHEKGWLLIDAGWMALSRDRGTAGQAVDQGYGLVCTAEGDILPDLIVTLTNQEHGIIEARPGSNAVLPDLPVGARLRIIPNHACATAAQHGAYHVVSPGSDAVDVWPRFGGW